MRLLRSILALAGAVLLLGVILGYGGPLWYDLDLLAHFRLHLLGLAVMLAIASLLLRASAALWNALAAAVLATVGLAPLWEGTGPPGEGTALTVMTVNIHSPNPQAAAMRRALIAADADLLLTIETDPELAEGPAGLLEHYPHWMMPDTGLTNVRTVIWSKFPLVERGPMPPSAKRYFFGVRAIVKIGPGIELSVMGVHLPHPGYWQGQRVEAFAELSADLPRPLVVMGDFNAAAWSWGVRRAEQVTGTRRVGGVLRTWDGRYPTPLGKLPEPFGLPIDHILVSEEIGVESIEALDIPGSDHDAVRAVLRIPERRGASETARALISTNR